MKTQQDSQPRAAACITSPLLARAGFTTPLVLVHFSSLFPLYSMCGLFHSRLLEIRALSIYYEIL